MLDKSLRNAAAVCSLTFLFACGGGGGSDDSSAGGTVFEMTIENISDAATLADSSGNPVAVAFSPAVVAIHNQTGIFFTTGAAASPGLESLAEDSDPGKLIAEFQHAPGLSLLGVAQTPVGETGASILLPGARYHLAVRANPGERLSLVSGFLQANDAFLATPDSGIELFDANGAPISGDITSSFQLLDAGTEVNEKPGEGQNQAPRESAANVGTPEGGVVHGLNDGFFYPAVPQMVRITIASSAS